MYNALSVNKRKLFLIVSLCLNLGLLFYFKYCNFFIENINSFLTVLNISEIKWVKLALPIGISFYTFESLTYVIDVYRRQHKPLTNFLQYQLYILLFPKLIAGPIIRFSEIADQITDRFSYYNTNKILLGICRFTIGLGKKVLIANVLAKVADEVFNLPSASLNTFECWLGALAYTFQIYFDFSGYSDMAVGLGKIFGFNFPENFDNPYTSKSITEFWKRWHMTLGNWMKHYLYIPLGGNQVNNTRLYVNLGIVFILSGFWHGAAWTFIFWGIYNGLWLILERLFLLNFYKKLGSLSIILSFLIVIIGWVIFRADTLDQALNHISHMFNVNVTGKHHVFISNKVKIIFLVATFFSFFSLLPFGTRIQNFLFNQENKPLLSQTIILMCCIFIYALALASITTSNFNPFIYFRF